MLHKAFLLARSLLILYLMFNLGKLIAYLVPVGVPGSIWGLLLLFIGLTTRIIQLEWVYFGANLLIRYMAVLFVPVSVGIIKYSDLLWEQMNILLIPNIVSTCVTLVFIGVVANMMFDRQSFSHKRKKVLARRMAEVEKDIQS